MKRKVSIIVGAGGQDGRLLTSLLQKKCQSVISITRDWVRGCEISRRFNILDSADVQNLIESVKPEKIFYLAAHHSSSEKNHEEITNNSYSSYHNVHVEGLLSFLNGIRNVSRKTRIFYAGSSLVFRGQELPNKQTEETPFDPVGFYGITKAQGIYLCRHYRKEFGIYAASGILYTHESHLRKNWFLSSKIIMGALAIYQGRQHAIEIGDLDAVNDWGYAADFVKAFDIITDQDKSDDYIISTGQARTVREFCNIVFERFGLDYRDYVRVAPDILKRKTLPRIGDFSRLHKRSGWKPSMSFEDMVRQLVDESINSQITL